jgi:lipopolysaccharide/colanic/teichoic acid biosynthesis glycosyltransferase
MEIRGTPQGVVESQEPFVGAMGGDLADLVERYASEEGMPPADWLHRHRLSPPLPGLRTQSLRARVLKRVFDLSAAVPALILLSPLLALAALLIRLTSRGPVLFTQVRVGLNLREADRDRRQLSAPLPEGVPERRRGDPDRRQDFAYGKPFVLYKLRTMRLDAEKDGARFAVAGDPRVTPVGRVLRRTRFDELPQLWNVIRGDMSLIGPRPERPEFIAELSRDVPGYLHRLRLKPGITGLAQVLNGYDNNLESFRKKVALDLLYLQNWSLMNDLRILLRTVSVVLTGKGAL